MQVLVAPELELDAAQAAADRVVAALQSDGILGEPELVERMVGNPFTGEGKWVRDRKVWPPGPRVLEALDVRVLEVTEEGMRVEMDGKPMTVIDFREKDPNHLEVEVGWELYCADDARFRCPHCGKKHPSPWDDGGVTDALEAARAGKPPELVCPTCNERVLVNDLDINPPGAAGPLAFRFMNWWPLRQSVIERMEEVAGTALCVVRV